MRRWRRAWQDGGTATVRSEGPVSREKLSPQQWARLEQELRKGPLAHGSAGRIPAIVATLASDGPDGIGLNESRCGPGR